MTKTKISIILVQRKEVIVANKPVISKDADKIYRKILLENIAQIIAYFKSVFKDNPEKIATSKRYIEQFSAKLKSASTERSVNRYTGEVETSDADDYAFYIAQEEQNISKLQSQLDLLVLLNNAFDKQLKINEVKETVAWQHSAAYAAISRYDPDDDDDSAEPDYDKMLSEYETELNKLCEKCLAYKQVRAVINFIIAENKRKQAIAKNPYYRKR